jgi:hypothetical protein
MKATTLRMISKVAAFAKLVILTQALMVLLAPVILARSDSAGPSVYVVTVGPNGPQFGTVNLGNGAFTAIASTPAPMSNLVWWNGSLLSLSTSDPFPGFLVKINPENGEISVIGATGLGSFAFDLAEVRGQLYLTDFNNDIYSVDPQTGAATRIGATGMPADPTQPFSTNPDGTFNLADESFYGVGGKLYATFDSFNVDETTLVIDGNPADATVSPALYRIDPFSGVAILVGPTNLFLSASVEVRGKFYAFKGVITGFAGGFPEGYNELAMLDLATGKVTFIRNIDVNAGVIFGAAPMRVFTELK